MLEILKWNYIKVSLLLCLAIIITSIPVYDKSKLRMPEPWSYGFAATNFSKGKWFITYDEYTEAKVEFRANNTILSQYIEVEADRWAFRQSPGFPLQVAAFYYFGLANYSNIVLSIISTLILYVALKRTFNEHVALLGIILFLWSPLTLLSIHYESMDTSSGGAWLVIGGSLFLILKQYNGIDNPRFTFLLEFLLGFSMGWVTVVRITSIPLTIMLFLFYMYFVVRNSLLEFELHNTKDSPRDKLYILINLMKKQRFLFLGIILPLVILVFYNLNAFGKVFDSGYSYPSIYDQYNSWNEDAATKVHFGVDTWLKGGRVSDILNSLLLHLQLWIKPGTLSWPLWILSLVGLLKFFKDQPNDVKPWLLFTWLVLAYLPFAGVIFFGVTRALSDPFNQVWGFYTPSRYLYPMIFPYVLTICYLLLKWKTHWQFTLVTCYVLVNTALFWKTLENAFSFSI